MKAEEASAKAKVKTEKAAQDDRTTTDKKRQTDDPIPAPTMSVSKEPSKPLPKPMPRRKSKVEQSIDVYEMLLSGMSIRDISGEGYPKSLVEQISKKMRKEGRLIKKPSGQKPTSRREYFEYPYQIAMKNVKKREENPYVQDIKDMMRARFQMDMARSIFGDSQRKGKIDVHELLLAKIVSGGKDFGPEQLTQFAASLKSLFNPEQSDFFAQYAAIKGLENQAVQTHDQVRSEAYKRAKDEASRDVVVEAIKQVAGPAKTLVSGLVGAAKKPTIPMPNVSLPNATNPGEAALSNPNLTREQIEALERASLPKSETVIPEAAKPPPKAEVSNPDSVGYSNLDPVYGHHGPSSTPKIKKGKRR